MEGGARPLHVNFETANNKALPPSAPKADATQMERRSVKTWEDDESLFEPEVFTNMVSDLCCCCCSGRRGKSSAEMDNYTRMPDSDYDTGNAANAVSRFRETPESDYI